MKLLFGLTVALLTFQSFADSICSRPLAIKHAILKELQFISLGLNKSFHCDQIASEDLKKINLLFLNNSDLKEITLKDLEGLEGLVYLDLSGNPELKTLPLGLIKTQLQAVNTAQTSISSYELYQKNQKLHRLSKAMPKTLKHIYDQFTSRLQNKIQSVWHLPAQFKFDLNEFHHTTDFEPRHKYMLAILQLNELRSAYSALEYDVYELDLKFSLTDHELDYHGSSSQLEIEIETKGKLPVLENVYKASDILSEIYKDYDYDHHSQWFKRQNGEYSMPRSSFYSGIKRDFEKLQKFDDQLKMDLYRLNLLKNQALERAEKNSGKRVIYSETEIYFIRLVQFRTIMQLERSLNTLVRWKNLLEDPQFPFYNDLNFLTSYAANIYVTYLKHFLHIVMTGSDDPEVGGRGVFHRQALFKIMDSELPAGFFEKNNQHRGIPEGTISRMLYDYAATVIQNSKYRFAKSYASRGDFQFTLNSPFLMNQYLTSNSVAILRKFDEKYNHYGRLRAAMARFDDVVKDITKVPVYFVIKEVAEFLGDTRIKHPTPAVTEKQLKEMEEILRPGDIILIRDDYYLSNAFLPGFWPHTVLYLGKESQWLNLPLGDGTKLGDDPYIYQNVLPAFRTSIDGHPNRTFEAISEGVVFSSMEHAVAKDYVVIIRPMISQEEIAKSLQHVLKYHGRKYDFDFDFATDEKLVCSEVAFRAYNDDFNFLITKHKGLKGDQKIPGVVTTAGRDTMPSMEIARYALYMHRNPHANEILGYPGQKMQVLRLYMKEKAREDARLFTGEEALKELETSFSR